jgi:hypothetical protein
MRDMSSIQLVEGGDSAETLLEEMSVEDLVGLLKERDSFAHDLQRKRAEARVWRQAFVDMREVGVRYAQVIAHLKETEPLMDLTRSDYALQSAIMKEIAAEAARTQRAVANELFAQEVEDVAEVAEE